MKPLLVPFTKLNPGSSTPLPDWRSKRAVQKSAEARKVLKKPVPRTLEKLNGND